ncbi:MAG: hypothetical protein JW732_00045 [Dehalococcoidia bacterium]|nr:hypothetical protein [Dehalococcoidia bacterium]
MGTGADSVKPFLVFTTNRATVMCKKLTVYRWIQAGKIEAVKLTDERLSISERSFRCCPGNYAFWMGLHGM